MVSLLNATRDGDPYITAIGEQFVPGRGWIVRVSSLNPANTRSKIPHSINGYVVVVDLTPTGHVGSPSNRLHMSKLDIRSELQSLWEAENTFMGGDSYPGPEPGKLHSLSVTYRGSFSKEPRKIRKLLPKFGREREEHTWRRKV